MFNKKIKLFMIMIVIAVCICGCGKSNMNKDKELNPKNPQVVKIFTYYTGNTLLEFKSSVKEFNDTVGKEKGIIVDVENGNGVVDSKKKLDDLAVKSVNDPSIFPDGFIEYKSDIATLLKYRQLIDYRDYFTDADLAKYEKNLIEDGYYGRENKLYAFPIGVSTDISYVNKTHWDKYKKILGFDEKDLASYEGILSAAQKYYEYTDAQTKEKYDGKALYGVDDMYQQAIKILEVMNGNITRYKNNQKIMNISKESAKKVWDVIYVPMLKGYYSKANRYIYEDFKLNDVIVTTASSSSPSYFSNIVFENDEAINIDVITMPSPQLKYGDKITIKQGGDMFLTKSTPIKQQATVEFIKWLTTKEHSIDFALKSTYLPVVKDYKMEEILQKMKETNYNKLKASSLWTAKNQISSIKPYKSSDDSKFAIILREMSDVFGKEARTKRMEILGRAKAGENYETLIEYYTNEDAFKRWYTNLLTRLNEKLN